MPPDTQPVIEVQNLKAQFGEDVILDRVSFTVLPGEIVIVAGGSGCGKSTLLKHMIGLHRPAAGRVFINQVDLANASEKRLARLRSKIGVTFQSGALLGSLTVLENVMLPLSDFTPLSPASAEQVARLKLSLVGLGGYENHLPSEISGGMMKRAGLARALALDPLAVFFDEPSAGLDPVTSAALDGLILSINRNMGTTMVIVTHELPSIFDIASRVVLLDKKAKGVIAQGPPLELARDAKDPRVHQFFNPRAKAQAPGGLTGKG